jgi:hypothetical protein
MSETKPGYSAKLAVLNSFGTAGFLVTDLRLKIV